MIQPRPGTILVELTEPQVRALIAMAELGEPSWRTKLRNTSAAAGRRAIGKLRHELNPTTYLPRMPEHPLNR